MPRIRTVKPEFWEDELLGVMPRDARLLFIATFNMADDEGILRWTPAYIKAQAFMYDDDLSPKDVDQLMQCLTDTGMVFPYVGGVAKQQMAVVVNFRKHQRINRPQKSKLPPPSLGTWQVREMYARRDGWTCQLCGSEIPRRIVRNDDHNLAIDHIRPVAAGGSDHPSNVRSVHQACGRSRYAVQDGEEFIPPTALVGLEDSLNESLNHSVNDSVNETHAQSNIEPSSDTDSDFSSLNHSLTEGKGREGNRERKGTPQPPAAKPSSRPAVMQTGERAIEDRMTDAFLDRYKAGNAYNQRQVRKVIADALANGTDSAELWKALERLGSLSKPVSAGTLQFAFSELRQPSSSSNVIALSSGQPLAGTDAKVAGWAAIAAKYTNGATA
ncbi:5-methylcytosine-specific restriction endonuclease McrA [Streptomyces sp. KhCrAH-43]|uniref:HNH endonuclease n=1 Tax=unclassified Streptomyces TaxID=2593676 RepID=UPI0004910970|nr:MULTISPECIES: HNH endonuclease [unclassified Streptomyces]MYX67296.1 HNH endonuclease [Streptomyces sp. SID8373]RAJ54891.1 5-methylcytosine-specific restriction endonuclease McrA [Streptomyces sp. KhCrAH-43]